MKSREFWDEFADVTVRRLVEPDAGDPLLILADANSDLNLAHALRAAGVRSGADTQLIVKPHARAGEAMQTGPILSASIKAAKYIVSIIDDGIDASQAMLDAKEGGTSILYTEPTGVEDYVVRALLNVDVGKMNRIGERVCELWENTDICRVTSPQGTDVSFRLKPRKCEFGNGMLDQPGKDDFYPGMQVNIAPVEETINGVIVIDASDSVQGVVHEPYSFTMENGVIAKVEGGSEADVMRAWLAGCNDSIIYKLCHFSLGLNPEAGISGRMIEDERKFGAIDFGFGYQNPILGGTVGMGDYHVDIMLAGPTVILDGEVLCSANEFNTGMLGFET
ncbi:MAG: hypothetical protein OXP09_13425 [Gammaproteobacteria bacterium]|nr:hypothetical protein [Gammaproteobacteria bacterium]MDE0366564.1 hypothetical protein [Gammaproteobacteria bacterium]